MSRATLNDDERRALLEDLVRLESDADRPDAGPLLHSFLRLPLHDRALDDGVLVVRGDRGSGKSAFFRVLSALESEGISIGELFPTARPTPSTWLDGFSQQELRHPQAENVTDFARKIDGDPERLRLMWVTHLLGRLREFDRDLPLQPVQPVLDCWTEERHDIEAWTARAGRHLPALSAALDNVERSLRRRERRLVICYDHLDRIGIYHRQSRDRVAASLLQLWLSLGNRYRMLGAKVFLREDIFSTGLTSGADASKLRARSILLTWDTAALYRLLIRHMANRSSGLRDWLQRGTNAIPVERHPRFGWLPPETLPETGQVSQRAFVEHLAGRLMGKGVKKGYVYRWIPNRLQDARRVVAPRAVVNLVQYASGCALQQGPRARYSRLLHPVELRRALEQTSRQRADEVREEFPVVQRMENLRGIQIPMERATAVRLLSTPSGQADDLGDDGNRALDLLLHVGVLHERTDGRIDVPDIYRFGYGIKRKGGVARPR